MVGQTGLGSNVNVRLYSAMPSRRVVFVLFDSFAALDVIGPADVFAEANRLATGTPPYGLRFVSDQTQVRASSGALFGTEPLDQVSPEKTEMLMVPGADEEPLRAALANAGLRDWVRAAASSAQRVCSVCSGAFILADLGLIKGKRATTHWRGLQLLRRWPGAPIVDQDALYTEDGNLWTSAGVTAGIDMALAMVERDLGRAAALKIARELVLFLVRPGGQSQFSAPLNLQARSAATDLSRLPFWLESRLTEPTTVEDMANAMGMSVRTFHRRCLAVFDQTPLQVLLTVRLERVRTLLEERSIPLKTIAARTGFSDAGLRRAFSDRFGVSPSDYRKCFG